MRVFLCILPLVFYAHALTMQTTLGSDAEVSRTITMDLESRMTCFYETLERDMILDLTYSSPYDSVTLAMRLTSPSGQFSEWVNGEDEVFMSHNVSENGDYEICLSTPSPITVTLSIFYRNPEKMEKAMDRYLEAHQIRGNLKSSVASMMGRLVKIYLSIRTYNKMKNTLLLLLLVLYSHALTMRTSAGDESYTGRSITMDLDSRMTCLYEPLKKNMTLKLSVNSMPGERHSISMRLSSPSAEFSHWADGQGSAYMEHNTTENGDYEICVNLYRPQRVTLEIFFFHPEKIKKSLDRHMEVTELSDLLSDSVYYLARYTFEIYKEIKFYNKVSVRDEDMQHSNSFYIKAYVIVFCLTNVVVAFVQVVLIHKMFFVDPKRMRV